MTERGHVLDDAWYLDYAAGALATEAHGVLMSSHLELSEDARTRVGLLDRVGGAMLSDGGVRPPTFSADDIFALDESRRGDEAGTPDPGSRTMSCDFPMPSALDAYLTRKGRSIRWEFLGPGLSKAMLWNGEDGTKLWLLRAQPGVSIPQHGHNGSELTLVLKGSFWDGNQQYCPGDVEEAHESIEHDIRIDDSGECVCLALTEGKLRFENPLLRLMQVFTGL